MIEYELKDLESLNKTIVVSKYIKSIEDYLKEFPNSQTVQVRRKIVKHVNNHLVLLDGEFPTDLLTTKFSLNEIVQKTSVKDASGIYNLMIYGDYVYCHMCQFLTSYKQGDSLFLKNGKFSEALRSTFKGSPYKSRIILEIIDDSLMRVEKNFPRDFQGLVLRKNYYVIDSRHGTTEWEYGNSSIKIKKNIIFGLRTKFSENIKNGDKIFIYDTNRVQEKFNQVSGVPKIYPEEDNLCVVEAVLSNNILLTKKPCKRVYPFKGDYIIGKRLDLLMMESRKPKLISHIIDFDTLESFKPNSNIENRYFTHPGFILNTQDSVIQMKFENTLQKNSNLRIILGTDLDFFNSGNINENNDYELLINSKTGALVQKIRQNQTNIEFYDMEIKSFFQEEIKIQLIFRNEHFYFSSSDDDGETSIKIKYPLESKIKYIYIDNKQTENIVINEIQKINFIETKYLFSIFVYEKRILLSENAYYVEILDNGDYCPQVQKNRIAIIEYQCDPSGVNDVLIENVKEENICEYKYNVKTRHLCNPTHIMRNKIERWVAKTTCQTSIRNFEKTDQDYFNLDVFN